MGNINSDHYLPYFSHITPSKKAPKTHIFLDLLPDPFQELAFFTPGLPDRKFRAKITQNWTSFSPAAASQNCSKQPGRNAQDYFDPTGPPGANLERQDHQQSCQKAQMFITNIDNFVPETL